MEELIVPKCKLMGKKIKRKGEIFRTLLWDSGLGGPGGVEKWTEEEVERGDQDVIFAPPTLLICLPTPFYLFFVLCYFGLFNFDFVCFRFRIMLF